MGYTSNQLARSKEIHTARTLLDMPATEVAKRLALDRHIKLPAPAELVPGVVLPVVVNHSRWLVNCPAPDCSGAELADADEAVFMCLSCFNGDVGGLWYAVEFPAPAERLEVAALLLERPAKNRNWLPGEDAAALRAENVKAGLRAGDRENE